MDEWTFQTSVHCTRNLLKKKKETDLTTASTSLESTLNKSIVQKQAKDRFRLPFHTSGRITCYKRSILRVALCHFSNAQPSNSVLRQTAFFKRVHVCNFSDVAQLLASVDLTKYICYTVRAIVSRMISITSICKMVKTTNSSFSLEISQTQDFIDVCFRHSNDVFKNQSYIKKKSIVEVFFFFFFF